MKITLVQDKQALEAAFRIRIAVFVDEQGVPLTDEIDGHEDEAEHILVHDDAGRPVGTGRWRSVDGAAKLERICMLASHRQHGIGRLIVGAMEDAARRHGMKKALLHGQVQAAPFYEKQGYEQVSEPYMEDGIFHVTMTKNI